MTVEVVPEFSEQGARVEDQKVDPGASIGGVVPVLPLEPVRIGSPEHDVPTATAQELILATVPEQLVVATEQIAKGVAGLGRSGVEVASEEIVAVATNEQILAQVGVP